MRRTPGRGWGRYDFEQCTVYRGGASQNGLGGNGGGSVCIPWTITATRTNATKGGFGLSHGFLWNMPNYGTVSFWDSNTTWMAEAALQIDYFVTVPPAGCAPSRAGPAIMNAYVDAVGHAPVMPAWATGYWHSRNRYSSQGMLLDAAKGFHERGVNVSVIVIDYMHWVHMGDFAFDPKSWPDVPGMMKTLESYGMRVMVSAWPFLSKGSDTRATVVNHSWAMTVQGTSDPVGWDDNNCVESGGGPCAIYDPTQQAAREYIWSRLRQGYYRYGIKIFWLDGSEPEISTQGAYASSKFYNDSLGLGQQVGRLLHARYAYSCRAFSAGDTATTCVFCDAERHDVPVVSHAHDPRRPRRRARERGRDAHTLRLGGHAALGRGTLERRHRQCLAVPQGVDPGRTEHADERHRVVDHRHWRVSAIYS